MKRIALSLAAIGMVVAMSAAATGAYFSSSAYVNGNTLTTGSVTMGSVSGDSMHVTNLIPVHGPVTIYLQFHIRDQSMLIYTQVLQVQVYRVAITI